MSSPSAVLFACLAAVLLPVPATATIRAELRLLAFQPDLATDEAYAHDPEATAEAVAIKTPVRTYLNHEFATVILSGRRIVFTTKPDRGSLTRADELLGNVTLPEGVGSAILLFLPPKAGGKARCQILPIDDAKRAFPAGSFRVSNLSPLPVRIVLEERAYNFKPAETALISDPPVRAGNQSGMTAFAFRDNAWQRIGSGIWPHPGPNRVVQILFHNPATDQVQLRAFDDVPPRAPAPPPDREAKNRK
jgi:hypothetical protein